MKRQHAFERREGRFRLAPLFVLALLLLLFAAGSAFAEETHTVVFKCSGSGRSGRDGKGRIVAVTPETQGGARTEDGRVWTLRGYELQYALECAGSRSEPQPVRPGENLWDVTDVLKARLESPEEPMNIVPVYDQYPWGMFVAEGSVTLQITFSTAAHLAAFRADRVQYHLIYETSLSMLEEGNPFVDWYDDTG